MSRKWIGGSEFQTDREKEDCKSNDRQQERKQIRDEEKPLENVNGERKREDNNV